MALLVLWVQWDLRAIKESLADLVNQVLAVSQEKLVDLVSQVFKALKVIAVIMACLVNQVNLDVQAFKVHQDCQVPVVQWVKWVFKASRENQAETVWMVNLVCLAPWVHKVKLDEWVHLVLVVQSDLLALPVQKEVKVTVVLLDVLVNVVLLVHKVLKESKVTVVNQVCLEDLVHQVLAVCLV